jgi:hypothetical protein
MTDSVATAPREPAEFESLTWRLPLLSRRRRLAEDAGELSERGNR